MAAIKPKHLVVGDILTTADLNEIKAVDVRPTGGRIRAPAPWPAPPAMPIGIVTSTAGDGGVTVQLSGINSVAADLDRAIDGLNQEAMMSPPRTPAYDYLRPPVEPEPTSVPKVPANPKKRRLRVR